MQRIKLPKKSFLILPNLCFCCVGNVGWWELEEVERAASRECGFGFCWRYLWTCLIIYFVDELVWFLSLIFGEGQLIVRLFHGFQLSYSSFPIPSLLFHVRRGVPFNIYYVFFYTSGFDSWRPWIFTPIPFMNNHSMQFLTNGPTLFWWKKKKKIEETLAILLLEFHHFYWELGSKLQ